MSNPKPFQDAQRRKEPSCKQGYNFNSMPTQMQPLRNIASSGKLRKAFK